ncbi:MAG: NAD(+) synthase [bacterium]|nr:NAD(+) synthase [bacterium]
MKLIKVGAAVVNQTPLDWQANTRHILGAITRAKEVGVSLLCLPELCITGYGCEDIFHAPGVQETALKVLEEVVPATAGITVALGLPLQYRKALFNVVALVSDGEIAGFVAKRFLAGDGLHYEPRWFKPWPEGRRCQVTIAGRRYPLGDLHFVCDGVGVGFEICEDAWVAQRPGKSLAARGVDVLLNPSASHFAFGKHEIRRRFVVEGSRTFGVSYVYANLLGNDAGRTIFDGGTLIASGGRILAAGRRFSFHDIELTTAVVDVDETRMLQVRSGGFQPDLDPQPGEQVQIDARFPHISCDPSHPQLEAWECGASLKEEEFTRAVALGLFDYLRKSRSRGFVVSLSGGADSAATSCLVALAVRLAIAELGVDGFRHKLPYLDLGDSDAGGDGAVRELVRRLLVCVYQATRNSSETTREAARSVASALGAEFLEFDVDALVEGYRAMVEDGVGRRLSWEDDDLALQNIQARARGPGIWMLANLRGALLLATSNRSEAAVGYATMDGDTCGGLSPIAGIDKAFLRRWLRWLEQQGPDGLGSIPALAKVNAQAPTAELQPRSAGQTDEQDLMPYELLDAIERAAIRDKKMPVEVYRLMRARFPEIAPRQLAHWVERFFRLWCRNQWKRERYAPSFHVDDENLDPKTWCRFPILSGGFERELEELRAWVAEEGDGG